MSKREALSRYSLIIRKLRRCRASFAEISDYLQRESEAQGYNFVVGKRTFQRDLEDIRSLYGVEISYDFSQKAYYIEDEALPDVNERMLEAFDTFNALSISDRISNFIHFEKRRPQGTENLHGLLHAIKNSQQVHFDYYKFWENTQTLRTVEPYALKEFRNRWYLLANDLKNGKIKSFALDRLNELEISKKSFSMPVHFDANQYFKYCFGIIAPSKGNPEEVVLSFTSFQGHYIKTLPLHESQQVIIDNETEFRIKLKLYITHDFVMELLSYGANLKVISPSHLIDEIKTAFIEGAKQYE